MRRAFTLIELLVVVSIIALLIAILLPVLGSVRRSAQSTQCLINQRQLAIGSSAYAADNRGEGPPPSDTIMNGVGAYAIWSIRAANWQNDPRLTARFESYRRIGVVMSQGYSNSPEILYCPSLTRNHEWLQPGGVNPDKSFIGGWFEESERAANGIEVINASYFYRETYAGKKYQPGGSPVLAELKNVLNFDRDPGDMVMLADVFADPDRGINDHHLNGYNFIRLDTSGDFFRDSSQQVEQFGGGGGYFAESQNAQASLLFEKAYESFRWGEIVADDLAKP